MQFNGISVAEARDKLAKYIADRFPNQSAAARYFKVSSSYMSRVLAGEQPPSGTMLTRIGYVRRVVYVEVGDGRA